MHDVTSSATTPHRPDPVLEYSRRVADTSRERLAALVSLRRSLGGSASLVGGETVLGELELAIEVAQADLAGAVDWLERVERARSHSAQLGRGVR